MSDFFPESLISSLVAGLQNTTQSQGVQSATAQDGDETNSPAAAPQDRAAVSLSASNRARHAEYFEALSRIYAQPVEETAQASFSETDPTAAKPPPTDRGRAAEKTPAPEKEQKDQAAGREPTTQKNQKNQTAGQELSAEEKQELAKLKQRDREVRAHEQAHVAAGGSMVQGAPHYEMEQGPDGKQYAVDGSVSISVRKGQTPQETIKRAQQTRRAALAPATPSAEDRQVALRAQNMARQAQQELQQEGGDPTEESGNPTTGPGSPEEP